MLLSQQAFGLGANPNGCLHHLLVLAFFGCVGTLTSTSTTRGGTGYGGSSTTMSTGAPPRGGEAGTGGRHARGELVEVLDAAEAWSGRSVDFCLHAQPIAWYHEHGGGCAFYAHSVTPTRATARPARAVEWAVNGVVGGLHTPLKAHWICRADFRTRQDLSPATESGERPQGDGFF